MYANKSLLAWYTLVHLAMTYAFSYIYRYRPTDVADATSSPRATRNNRPQCTAECRVAVEILADGIKLIFIIGFPMFIAIFAA